MSFSRRSLLAALLFCSLVPQTGRADLLDAIGEGLGSLGDAVGSAVTEGVQGGVALAKGAKVRGRYYMPELGQTVTCFEGIKTGYILPPGATSPGAPGTAVTPLNCDAMAKQAVPRGIAQQQRGTQVAAGDNCPEAGDLSSAREARAYAECFSRDAGYDDDFAAQRQRTLENAAADKAEFDRKIQQIQDTSAKEFARIQAKAARDAAAAQAQAGAARR